MICAAMSWKLMYLYRNFTEDDHREKEGVMLMLLAWIVNGRGLLLNLWKFSRMEFL